MSQASEYFVTAATLALAIYSIVLHEVAHALAAFLLGDPTAKLRGRLTLNPIKHIDPFFTIIMPLILYLTAGFVFGGAKPVPVNPYLFKKMRKGMAITGMAGPAMNLLIMLTCVLVARLLRLLVESDFLAGPLLVFYWIFVGVGFWNMILMVFNMLPIPPLDGSRLLYYLLPRDLAAQVEKLERFGLLIVMIAVMTGVLRPVFRAAEVAYSFLVGFSFRM